MTNAVKKFFGGGKVADRAAMQAKLSKAKSPKTASVMGGPWLTTNKAGVFVFGQDNAPMPDGTFWAFNIMTAMVGWANWCDGKKQEKMKSIWDDEPYLEEDLPEPPDTKRGKSTEWNPAYSWDIRAMNGPIEGMSMKYDTSALYGRRISEALIDTVTERLDDEEEFIIPVIELYNEPYQHPEHGELNHHKFHFVGWAHVSKPEVQWEEGADPNAKKLAAPTKKTRAPRKRRSAA